MKSPDLFKKKQGRSRMSNFPVMNLTQTPQSRISPSIKGDFSKRNKKKVKSPISYIQKQVFTTTHNRTVETECQMVEMRKYKSKETVTSHTELNQTQ